MTTIYRDISLGRATASAMKDLRRWMPSLRSTCNSFGVTGRLLYDGECYLSVLEGVPRHVDRVKRMMEIRLVDGRLRTLLTNSDIVRDHFAWTLGFLYEDAQIETVRTLANIEFPEAAHVHDIVPRLCFDSDSLT